MENTERITVTLERAFPTREMGDVVCHWIASTENPPLEVTGRSIQTVERALRAALARDAGWPVARAQSVDFAFEIPDAAPESKAAIRARRDAHESLRVAKSELLRITAEAAARLLIGPPALSLADAARILGASKPDLYRLASLRPELKGPSRRRIKNAERQRAIENKKSRARMGMRERAIEKAITAIEKQFSKS